MRREVAVLGEKTETSCQEETWSPRQPFKIGMAIPASFELSSSSETVSMEVLEVKSLTIIIQRTPVASPGSQADGLA